MSVQPEILDLLRCLPVSARLGVRRDVRGVQEFYSLISWYGSYPREWVCRFYCSGCISWLQVPFKEHDSYGCSVDLNLKSINQFFMKLEYGTHTVRFRGAAELLQTQQGHRNQYKTISPRNNTIHNKIYNPSLYNQHPSSILHQDIS